MTRVDQTFVQAKKDGGVEAISGGKGSNQFKEEYVYLSSCGGLGGIFCDFVIVESYARLKVEEVRETSQGK